MPTKNRTRTALTLAAVAMALLVLPAAAKEPPAQLPDPDKAPPDTSKPVQVYILAGQSNMPHMGSISAGESGARIYRESDKPDAKKSANVSLYKGKFPYLLGKDGNWVERDDVFYQEARLNSGWNWDPNNPNKMLLDEAKLKASCKPLTIESNGIWVGVPFGFYLGDYHDEQVLLIRTAMGNRALAWDFRSPSSGKLPDIREDLKKWEGLEYRLMVKGVRKSLDNIATILPDYKGQGYKIAGFAWFQGHKDGGKQEWTDEYESNLVNLIKDVRAEFKVPKLPVVVATVAFGGREMKDRYQQILEAQIAVSDQARKTVLQTPERLL